MDQFTVAMGRKNNAIFLDTATLRYEYAPIELEDRKIIITNSKVKHSLVDSNIMNAGRNIADAPICTAARNWILIRWEIWIWTPLTNSRRSSKTRADKTGKTCSFRRTNTIEAVKALKSSNIAHFGALMNQSHISLRDDYEVSLKRVDIPADLAWLSRCNRLQNYGRRNFGGCTVSIVKE